MTFTASATTSVSGTSNLNVTDNEILALTVSLNAVSVSEGAGVSATTGTVTRSGDLGSALIVAFASNDTTEATVPGSVTIAAGQASATFAIAAIDDAVVDGTQVVICSIAMASAA